MTDTAKTNFSWENEDLWTIRIDERQMGDFIRPCVGTGIVGTRFAELVTAPWADKPLTTATRFIYDDGQQLRLPAWNHIDLRIEGILYVLGNGRHHAEQTLDLRTGLVRARDTWEYKPGRVVEIEVEMLLTRQLPHCGYLTFSVSGLTEPSTVAFGLKGEDLSGSYRARFEKSGNVLVGEYRTAVQDRPVTQGLRWEIEGGDEPTLEAWGAMARLATQTTGSRFGLTLFHSVHGCLEEGYAHHLVEDELETMASRGVAELRAGNESVWRELWATGLAFEHEDPFVTQMLLAHQYYLLQSLSTDVLPLGACGVSDILWNGSQLWDAECWMFPAVLALWPALAESILRYRRSQLEGARKHAEAHGYRGAWFPWMTDETGADVTPEGYTNELHINIHIGLAAWSYYEKTRNPEFLREVAWPLLSGVTEFFCSRAVQDENGVYHLKGVLGPDEGVWEALHRFCDDNFTTNYGVKRLVQAATACAGEVGEAVPEHWGAVADALYLVPAGPDGIIPEYAGYDGHRVKQADLTLAFYPLGYPVDKETMLKNIRYYDPRAAGGPVMTTQISACLMMKAGETQAGLKYLFDTIRGFVRGPHYVVVECWGNKKSIILTGIGGELQALIYGYYGATPADHTAVARIGDYW